MSRTWSIRLQIGLVIALFLGSLATVLFNAFQTIRLPRREFEVQDRLRAASRQLAEEAEPELMSFQAKGGPQFGPFNEKLRAISRRVLAAHPGVEGGFYLDADLDRFAGFAFPNDPYRPAPPAPEVPAPSPKQYLPKEKVPPLGSGGGDDPPPKERPFIHVQAQNCLSLDPGAFDFNVRTVGPSRVAILTEPVGPKHPARLATWVMFRLISPETQESQLHRYQLSTGLALGGIALAVLLTVNLGRTLKRQRLEQERLQDELRHSEQLAALGKLLAGVAHEVRNPLAGIRSTVQLWERLPDTARTPGSIRAVIQAVDRLNDIISRLLYFARSDHTGRQPVSVNAVLTETLNLLEAQAAGQCVALERELDPDLPSVSGSAIALLQVFLNLVTNALQAMPQGGKLHCRTRYDPQQRSVEVRIADTGPGIVPEARRHLFEPFFTTRPDGTGLGLALCREIALQHGGRIELEAGGPGASFRVLLPTAG
jgi:signal transduction histidine kinase